MNFFRIIFILLLMISSCYSFHKEDKVVLQLNWKYQFEFAGFIAAKEKGFYKDLGLDVDIKEFDFGINVMDEINSGRATFGIYDLSLLTLENEKNNLKLIANYFKRSALVFVTRQGIVTPNDLRDKIIMADKLQLTSSTLSTLLKKFKIQRSDYYFQQHNFSPDDFINGKVDVMSAYLSNELFILQKSKKPYNIIDPMSYGIYGSGVNVFTSNKFIKIKPTVVDDFIKATNKGWEYALRNKDEIVKIIYDKYSKLKSIEALKFEANEVEKLIMPNIYHIGEVNKSLIEKNINDFSSEGILSNKVNINSFIYNTEKNSSKQLHFTLEQKKYIKNKEEIKMCIDPNWMPYEKIENGKHIGMTSEYMKIISKKIGIPINLVPTKTWAQSIEFAKERKCDIFSLAMSTPERLKYMNFTVPYMSFPIVVASKMDELFIPNPDEIITSKKFAIVKGYSITEILKRRHPNNKLVEVKNVKEGMSLLSQGKVFGFIGALPTIAFELQHNHMGELKIAGKFHDSFELGIGVRNDDRILFELFQKALQSIDEVSRQEILNRYVSVKVEGGFNYKLFYQVFFVVAVIIAFIIYRNRQLLVYNRLLKKQREELSLTQNELKASLNAFRKLFDSVMEGVMVFENKICIDANDVAVEILGYESKSELLGRDVRSFIPKEEISKIEEKFKGNSSAYKSQGLKKNGDILNVIIKGTNTKLNGKNVRISSFIDVTEMQYKEKILFQQSKMASMGQMLENIAHQWRQPLSYISTISTGLELKKTAKVIDFEEEMKDLKKINSTVQYLSDTIEDFRNFFKSDKQKTEFSILKSIEKNLFLLDGIIKNNNIDIVFKNKQDVVIFNYENELTQALMNIFYNANDVMQKLSKNKYIIIDIVKEEKFISISIKDNGGGIDEKHIEHIFEPYFTTKHQSQGTGVGLFMTHQIIVNHMGGIISVKNSKYSYNNQELFGAEFIIKLPL